MQKYEMQIAGNVMPKVKVMPYAVSVQLG